MYPKVNLEMGPTFVHKNMRYDEMNEAEKFDQYRDGKGRGYTAPLRPQPSALRPQPSALSPQPSALRPPPSALSLRPQPSAFALSPQP